MKDIYYITTPLYYVNAKPHIGHAYTNIVADTFARFKRFQGEKVFFLTGTDEHGGKINRIAKEQGKETKQFVDEMAEQFKDLWKKLEITHDYFIRTTDKEHKQIVKNILTVLHDKGDIYKGKYKGWYCTPCESFWTPEHRPDGLSLCPDCKRAVEEIEEENYFFKLSKYQDWLIEYIKSHDTFIYPKSRKNEILSFLERPLEDLCITRPKTRLLWGIQFPLSSDYVVYVWFDALINYISAIKYSLENKKFNEIWPADLHVMAKDILRQHAVYWPIMLKSLDLPIPKTVLAHGWWTMEDMKISKSRGNIVDPVEVISRYGVDTFRYFLLREVTLGMDGSYSEDLLINRFNNDLANDLGNLVHRSFGMLEKYYKGKIPACPVDKIKSSLKKEGLEFFKNVERSMASYDPKGALEEIWRFVNSANKFVEDSKPWVLAKGEDKSKLAEFMYTLFETLRIIGVSLTPFLPDTSNKILVLLKAEASPSRSSLEKWGLLKPETVLEKGAPLFPKME